MTPRLYIVCGCKCEFTAALELDLRRVAKAFLADTEELASVEFQGGRYGRHWYRLTVIITALQAKRLAEELKNQLAAVATCRVEECFSFYPEN